LYVFKNKGASWDEIINSFYLASTNDTILQEIAGKKTHSHGWGYVVYRFYGGKAFLSYYRTPTSISNDGEGVDFLKGLGKLMSEVQVLIVHSRLTGEKEVKNVENTHPYMEHVPGKFTLWLAHNGRVSKTSLAREVKLESYISIYSDTYFLTKYLATKIPSTASMHNVASVLREIVEKGYVISALNIVALIMLNDERVYGFALNYIAPKASEREEYYRLYMVSPSNNEKIVASSTFTRYFRNGEIRALNNGDMVFFEIVDGELRFHLSNIFKT